MPNPYTARVDVRQFLNFPGFHDGAYVVAYLEDTSERAATSRRGPLPGATSSFHNPRPRAILEIADCVQRINLELEVHSGLALANSLHKLDTLAGALAALRAALPEEARLYRERERRLARRRRKRRRAAAQRGPAPPRHGRSGH